MISAGHFLSHFYALVLPPLFPLLKAEFGVSYLQLGLAMTAYSLLGGVMQAPVGFLVDRIGPRRVLLVGLGLNALAVLLMGFADAYWILLVLALCAGLGNSVFHPADYAILSGSINPARLGRAFSAHTFSGFLGGACAPVAILILAQWADWRTALIAVGALGLLALAVMALLRDVLMGEGSPAQADSEGDTSTKSPPSQATGWRLLMTPPILLYLGFFVLYGMTSGGLIAFTVSGLVDLHGLALQDANTALTAHLFGVVAGILLAGIVADRFSRHLVTVGVALMIAAGAAASVVIASGSSLILIAVMTLAGVGLGAVLPPRDLMIRAIVPTGQTGKVFGFVFVGYSIGHSVAPLLFGWFLDAGQPALVFLFAALFALAALVVVAAAHRLSRPR